MASGSGLDALTRKNRLQPSAEGGMGRESCSPVDGVHLLFQRLRRRVDEESRQRLASTAPDHVRGLVAIEPSSFVEDSIVLPSIGKISADVVEFLFRVGGGGLVFMSLHTYAQLEVVARTLITSRAAVNLTTLRETMITFAPFCASSVATLLPMPSEPPVIKTVCIYISTEFSPCNSNTYVPFPSHRTGFSNWIRTSSPRNKGRRSRPQLQSPTAQLNKP